MDWAQDVAVHLALATGVPWVVERRHVVAPRHGVAVAVDRLQRAVAAGASLPVLVTLIATELREGDPRRHPEDLRVHLLTTPPLGVRQRLSESLWLGAFLDRPLRSRPVQPDDVDDAAEVLAVAVEQTLRPPDHLTAVRAGGPVATLAGPDAWGAAAALSLVADHAVLALIAAECASVLLSAQPTAWAAFVPWTVNQAAILSSPPPSLYRFHAGAVRPVS